MARRRLPIGIRTSVEYDAAGEPAATGSAARAVFYSEREDPSVAGAIRLRSESQGVSLEAQSLRWEGLRHRLVSEQEVVHRARRRLRGDAPAGWTWTCAASGSASPPP